MEKNFKPNLIEEKMYKNWEDKGYFKTKIDKSKKPFSIVMPPPNVTGKLHMGHALDQTIQDIFIRYNRMKGVPTLWIPGTDHASIATEVKVVEKLREQGIEKHEIGREEFLKHAWDWTNTYGGEIKNQIRKLGSSCDFSKERFTLDETCSKAVEEVFIKLYEKGYLYRGERIVNWCPCCKTSISDTEVEHIENKGNLWYIKYMVEDSDEYIIVATTRPETMLGDTGIAVNPKDERYTNLIGKNVILPIVNRKIPIVADNYVESDFGTGAVKMTPAHDINDFEVSKRHDLEIINILNEDGTLNENAGEYKGLDRYVAREKIVSKLKELNILEKIEDYNNKVGTCYRCKTVVEPYLSKQWFVSMKELAKPAIEAVKKEDIKFIPKRFEKTYFNWMENIQDWCVSRQLWWGHRIPAYYCDNCGEIVVSKDKVTTCKCGGKLHQDEDSLDTWFSSALWPFSVFGWPEDNEELKYFYPTSTLVTGYDIITFWVSKMIFSGLEFMNDIPFENVYIHGIVRDSQGRKMSKSLGNGIDPLEIISEYGADALRFSLIQNISPGNDIRYIPEKLESSRNFINKIWNAAKFVNMYLKDYKELDEYDFKPIDKWIINKLNETILKVDNLTKNHDIGIALNEIYSFVLSDFCDWYIEMVKPRLYTKDESYYTAIYTLNYVFKQAIKLLHPYIPFVTEEIYSNLKHQDESIMISKFPEVEYNFKDSNDLIEDIKILITNIRNMKSENNVPNSKKLDIYIDANTNIQNEIKLNEDYIEKLGNVENIYYDNSVKDYTLYNLNKFNVYVDYTKMIDKDEEIKKLTKELEVANNEFKRANNMLSNDKFISKAPEKLVNLEKEKVEKYSKIIQELNDKLSSM